MSGTNGVMSVAGLYYELRRLWVCQEYRQPQLGDGEMRHCVVEPDCEEMQVVADWCEEHGAQRTAALLRHLMTEGLTGDDGYPPGQQARAIKWDETLIKFGCDLGQPNRESSE